MGFCSGCLEERLMGRETQSKTGRAGPGGQAGRHSERRGRRRGVPVGSVQPGDSGHLSAMGWLAFSEVVTRRGGGG